MDNSADKTYEDFRGIFEPDLLDEISNCKIVDVSAETIILNDGSYIKEIPLLLEGSVKVIKTDNTGKEIMLYQLNPGQSCILSITSSLNNKYSQARAVTVASSKMILATSQQVQTWMDKYLTWRRFVMKLYYERLSELLMLVDSIAFRHVDFRLIEKLKEKAGASNSPVLITHQQLANELGTAREVVSRLLKQLEKEKKIAISRGKIIILQSL